MPATAPSSTGSKNGGELEPPVERDPIPALDRALERTIHEGLAGHTRAIDKGPALAPAFDEALADEAFEGAVDGIRRAALGRSLPPWRQ